ncbi:hypothetical protein CDEST_12190 [Colletotrichum destructivum]|uniref:Uncharacterized protein n=1 Tax=Colletotrichum destructivum TaxID=34406 RepID=A0AAX4IVE4_9PEZI|nr:hypothetical protein CDEST_12190 [Colletotrichum destructivum]
MSLLPLPPFLTQKHASNGTCSFKNGATSTYTGNDRYRLPLLITKQFHIPSWRSPFVPRRVGCNKTQTPR